MIPRNGGLLHFNKNDSFSLPSSNKILLSLGFITNIKISRLLPSKEYQTLFKDSEKNHNISLFYKKSNFPFEDEYIDDIILKCGDIDYKLLENEYLMNNQIDRGFQIYYKKKNLKKYFLNFHIFHIYFWKF